MRRVDDDGDFQRSPACKAPFELLGVEKSALLRAGANSYLQLSAAFLEFEWT
jgi:hypothetical protein